MKLYKFLNSLVIGIIFITGITSCNDYLDVNEDPNNPTETTPNLILPVAQHYTAAYIADDRMANHLGNMFMYNWSEAHGFSWYEDEFLYLVTTTFYDDLFDDAYAMSLKQYHALTTLEGPEYGYYEAIGEIMKAYHFQMLVDIYGDVPYFNALQRGEGATPVYDNAEDIYADLLVKLADAITLIKTTAEEDVVVAPGGDDTMFAGDMDKWIQFANSLRLRIIVRGANSLNAQSEYAKIESEGSGFIEDDVIVDPGYLKEEGKQNPLWNTFGESPDGTETLTNRATVATEYIIDYLQSTGDPRIDYLYEEPETGHAGVNQGVEQVAEQHNFEVLSNIGPGVLKGPDAGVVIFTLAENYFNEAEAALDGYGTGVAQDLYEAGIEASFAYLGVPLADEEGEDDNITNDYEDYVATVDPVSLEAIITQKWLALNGINALQSWFDYTRTGFPANLPKSLQAGGKDRPVRLFYPASEKAYNPKNVPSQPDAFTDKIFWAN